MAALLHNAGLSITRPQGAPSRVSMRITASKTHSFSRSIRPCLRNGPNKRAGVRITSSNNAPAGEGRPYTMVQSYSTDLPAANGEARIKVGCACAASWLAVGCGQWPTAAVDTRAARAVHQPARRRRFASMHAHTISHAAACKPSATP
jgi:hypothetical protein